MDINIARDIKIGLDSRTKLLKGVKQMADAVVTTLGPNGRNVVIGLTNGPGIIPQSTKDGVTVAKHIALKDSFENLGAQMVKEAAVRTGDIAGSLILGFVNCKPSCLTFHAKPFGVVPHSVIRATSFKFLVVCKSTPPLIVPSVTVFRNEPTSVSDNKFIGFCIKGSGLKPNSGLSKAGNCPNL